jgi:hypothetical protein
MFDPLPDFLPGRLTLARGNSSDYHALAEFHYVARRPATWASVWTVRYTEPTIPPAHYAQSRVVAVGVLSYPVPSCRARERYFRRTHLTRNQNLRFANRHIRTISRVIVHPQFRSLGLSTALVRCLCANCDTRYIEAIAMMARAHPFFERAGMQRIESIDPDEPAYFILDRHASSNVPKVSQAFSLCEVPPT